MALETSRELLFGQFQKRLPHKPTTGIKHGSGQFRVPELLCDLAEGVLHALRIRQVGADAHGLSAAGVDLLHQRVEAGWISSKNYDGIRLGESPCYRCALQIGLIRSTRDLCGGRDWGTLKILKILKRTVPGPTPAMTANALEAIFGSSSTIKQSRRGSGSV